ncbi:hypothetical protein QTI24_29490 [Variovorax sp. J22P240]|uniref:hypothetical protein n=1 Tax=Variovorax sp. J22P240 TaxID=3053514 RepID=UPI0025757FA6|nr:hypothetical protein [Variovorax sp. J22P240]MDM0002761.1 hypothetical protein [Variovorax sp. J22P240]
MEPMKPMQPMAPMTPMEKAAWWPPGLGSPATVGAQDDWRYAFFPDERRLVVEHSGKVTQYDTGDHAIVGVSQRQGGSGAGLVFTSQHGLVTLAMLDPIP